MRSISSGEAVVLVRSLSRVAIYPFYMSKAGVYAELMGFAGGRSPRRPGAVAG
jgi:hypothetical protein